MDPKPHPNHTVYVEALRRMRPAGRLAKVFELSQFTKDLFIHGLRKRHPEMPSEEFNRLVLWHLERCHNRNY